LAKVPFSLAQVVPWGRSFGEYERMFALTGHDLSCRMLGCGDGPASFNAEGHRRGVAITSCDPIYAFRAEEIRQRIDDTSAAIVEQTRQHAGQFVWNSIRTVEELRATRLAAMDLFLDDFASRRGRYVAAALPELPFRDAAFDLALCSHFLFLYSRHFDLDSHRRALRDLCRVAGEVRVFPLLALDGQRSPYVDPLVGEMHAAGIEAAIEPVPYEFQRGGNEMLRICRGRPDRMRGAGGWHA
jgi:hypothetical protein